MQGHSASDAGYRLNRNNIRIDVPVPENNSKQVSLQFYLYRLHLLRPFRPVFQKKKKKKTALKSIGQLQQIWQALMYITN